MIHVIYPIGEGNVLLFEAGGVKKSFRNDDEVTITLRHIETSLVFELTATMTDCNGYYISFETDEDIYKIYLEGFEVLDIIKK